MSGYVVAGYGVTVVTLAAYALRVVRRGRVLTRSLQREERTWR
ncbi:MAG: heme exporter protein CcmD [Actinomycetota bacterium]|nr:heme exporter protein CcmD [Actinomycetota bacterium]